MRKYWNKPKGDHRNRIAVNPMIFLYIRSQKVMFYTSIAKCYLGDYADINKPYWKLASTAIMMKSPECALLLLICIFGFHNTIQGALNQVKYELHEGDIILNRQQTRLIEKTLKSKNQRNRSKRKIIPFRIFKESKWTFPIKYKFNYYPLNGGERWKAAIRKAIYKWENTTCIRFQEVLDHEEEPKSPYISFTNSQSGCFSYVGRQPNVVPQPINFDDGCLNSSGTLEHEIAHALGFWHEHARPDRDQYVRINSKNIVKTLESNFLKVPGVQSETYGVEYDYSSVMHYHEKAFSNQGVTLVALDDLYQSTMGQRVGLSFADIKVANIAYKCNWNCRPLPVGKSCKWGGYVDPNNCSQCVCPDGFGGRYCDGIESGKPDECSGFLNATIEPQLITSPDYPRHYQDFQHCNWRIIAPKGCRIVLRFVDYFEIFCKNDVCYHWLEIKYTKSLGLPGPRFCCKPEKMPEALISKTNEAVVLFRSDYKSETTHRGGFKLEYSLQLPDSSCEAALGLTTTLTTKTSAPTVPDISNHTDGNITTGDQTPPRTTPSRRTKPTAPPVEDQLCGGCTGPPNSIQPKCETESKCKLPSGLKVDCKKMSCCKNARAVNSTHCQVPTCRNWDPWSICSRSCGACGIQIRYRTCIYKNPDLEFQGSQERVCKTQVCKPECEEKVLCKLLRPWNEQHLCERLCKPCCKPYTEEDGQCVM
ncbi:unnamed protein product [Owenia fusiformis]|uniref:Metalloendopeptidase n=1 Tax=Owenia fusiformis TaxID=6347 RepID=A0A8S4N0E4_OWEFU|nr:unnamed protein product [Owenia fusiformis]